MNVFDVADRFAALDRSVVILDAERCLHSLYRFSDCEACHEICPASAITPGKPPSLQSESCQTCLACLPVCPVGAFSADDSVASLLNAVTHLEGGTLELLCKRNAQAAMGVSATGTGIFVRGCLAGLGTGAYLALAAFGLDHILVRMDACTACEWGQLAGQVETQVSQAGRLLKSWGKAGTLECVSRLDSPVERPLWKAANPPLSRRDLFRMASRQGQIALARSIENGQPQTGHHPGREHQRLVGAITHLPAPDPTQSLDLGGMSFASLSVTEACTACGACARACPTRAIQLELEGETSFKLTLSVRDCIGCEICANVCIPLAVTVEHAPTFEQVFGGKSTILQEGGLIKCEHCGVLMAARPDVHLCQLCEYRRVHPFGSINLPGLKNPRQPSAAVKQQ